MNQLPRVIIDIPKIIHNYQTVQSRFSQARMKLTGVIKGIAGDERIIQALIDAGLSDIGDSRLENLRRVKAAPGIRRVLLRLPAPSRIGETLEYSELSLNTEKTTLASLDTLSKKHQVFLMVDLGDLREGILDQDLDELGHFCKGLKNIEVIGLGTNFSCFAGAIPTHLKLMKLVQLADWLKTEYKLPLQFVSGGNSSSLPLLYSGTMPEGVNHLRIGEGILLGRETLHGEFLPDLYHDTFIVEAEVIQAQWKPSQPEGETGYDAFGRKPKLPQLEAGVRLLINLGHQDTPLTGLTPLEPGLTVMGGSSDYLVVASERMVKVGETIRFLPNYWSMLGIMTSPYVAKLYIN